MKLDGQILAPSLNHKNGALFMKFLADSMEGFRKNYSAVSKIGGMNNSGTQVCGPQTCVPMLNY